MKRLAPILCLVLAGCEGKASIFAPKGPGAGSLAGVGLFVTVLFSLVTLVMLGLLVFVAVRRKGTLAEHAPYDAGGGQPVILIGGFTLPAIILAVVFIVGLVKMDDFPLDGHMQGAKPEIRVIGRQWWWEVQYLGESPHFRLTTANEIHVPVGRPIEIELLSHDVIHAFWVPELHGKVDLVPGFSNRLRIQVDEPGVYEGRCAEFCGAQHANMRILLVAENPDHFESWLRRQRRPAQIPEDELAMEGMKLFETRACGLCHTVRGTRALGTVGPDLTHLASRRRIGANSLPNQHAYLAAWATRAQSLKPEVKMPNVSDFTGQELRAIAQFLNQLE